MTQDTLNIIISGLMGLIGGFVTLPISTLFSWLLKKEEINLQTKITQREIRLQEQLKLENEKKIRTIQTQLDYALEREKRKLDIPIFSNKELSEIKSRIEKLENIIIRLSSNGN